MKIFIILIALGLGVFLRAEEKPAVPTMPEEITLTSGRVLKKVSVVRWEKERVVLKYAGGVEPVHFSLIKNLSRAELNALRDEGLKTAARALAPKNRVITGQVFVTTRGAGAYKFSAALIRVLPVSLYESTKSEVENKVSSDRFRKGALEYFDEAQSRYRAWQSALENSIPLGETTTDAEGKYKLNLSANEPVFLFCTAYRSAGGAPEYNIWAVPVGAEDQIDLNSRNSL